MVNDSWSELDNFNPRSREGSDPDENISIITQVIFQSALPRGERRGIRDSLSKI